MKSSAGPLPLAALALAMSLPLAEGGAPLPQERSYIEGHMNSSGWPVGASEAVRTGDTL